MSDIGYVLLLAFFIFWTVQILVGVIVELANLGYHRGNFVSHTKELFNSFIYRLNHPSKGSSRARVRSH